MTFAVVSLAVGDAVVVLVVVGGAVIRGPRVEQDPAGDIASDHERRTALQQVVRIELRRVGGRDRGPIAGRGDRALDKQRAADVAADEDANRVLALGDDRLRRWRC